MKHHFSFLSAVLVLAAAGRAAEPAPASLAASTDRALRHLSTAAGEDVSDRKIELKKGDRILFFGDSLTELAGREEPKKLVTKGYVRIVREKVDDNNVRVSQLSQEVDALRQAIQQAGARTSTRRG